MFLAPFPGFPMKIRIGLSFLAITIAIICSCRRASGTYFQRCFRPQGYSFTLHPGRHLVCLPHNKQCDLIPVVQFPKTGFRTSSTGPSLFTSPAPCGVVKRLSHSRAASPRSSFLLPSGSFLFATWDCSKPVPSFLSPSGRFPFFTWDCSKPVLPLPHKAFSSYFPFFCFPFLVLSIHFTNNNSHPP